MESSEKLPQLFFNGDATFSMPCPLTDLRRLAPKWSLAGDAQLLGFMQNFSNKLIAQTKDIQRQLNSLTYNTKMMDVKLNNVFNDFNMLANTQFVENRVYDEDPCILQQAVEEKPKKSEMSEMERDAEMMRMMNEAVQLCKKALDGPSNPVRKDRYAARTLPTLLNCRQKSPVGDRIRTKSANRVEPSSNNPPVSQEADKLSQTSDASEARGPPSSLESSLKVESLQGRKESAKDLFADDNEDSDGDLFSKPVKVPKIIHAKSKDQLIGSLDAMFKSQTTKQEIASSSSSLASDRLAKENKGRVKSLFDESDSGEDDDIFEQISNVVNKRPGADRSTSKPDDDDEKALPSTKKVPVGAVSVFGSAPGGRRPPLVRSQKPHLNDDEGTDKFTQSSSSSSLDSKSKQRHLVTKKPLSLFDDDEDDDGDLFSSTVKKPIVESSGPEPRERPSEQIAKAETWDERVPKVQKPVPVKSLFDDDDDDDDDDEDIFSKLAKLSSKAVKDPRTKDDEVMSPTAAVSTANPVGPPKSESPKRIRSIFDDDDDDGGDEILSVNKDVKTSVQAIPNPAQKIKSIFDDDEEDDGADLFEDLLKSTKKAAWEAKEKLNSERKADAAETKPTEALPPKTKPPEALPPKTKPPEALPSEAKPPVLPSGAKKNSSQSTSGIPQVAKVGKSLFDDDDDECDLFSSLLKNKPPPMEKEEVVEQRLQTIDKPREQRATTTTTIATTATDNSNQQKQLSTLDEQNDSKESEPKTATSPQKSKVKGDRISKLQTSLNIDPLSLGPFSHKKIHKESIEDDKNDKELKEDDKVEEERGNKSKSAVVVRVGGDAGLPSADVTKNSLCNGPKSASDDNEALPKKSDLDVGATSMLPSLVKGRPKVMGRRRPMTRNQVGEDVDDKNFSQSNSKIESTEREVLSNRSEKLETSSWLNDFLVHQPEDLTAIQKDRTIPDKILPPSSRLFGDVESESPFSESVDKTLQESPVRYSLKQDDVRDFFDTGSDICEEKVEKNPCKSKSNDFEPPPLFSDDDDDDDEEEDLFGNFQKRVDSSEKDVLKVKQDVAHSKEARDKIAEESKTSLEKKVILAFDDDDDEDLFAAPKPETELSKKPVLPIAKTTPVQVAPIFGNDDDDDLFSDVSLTKTSASKSELTPPMSSSSNGPMNAVTKNATTAPTCNIVPASSSNPAGKSLFEEEDDDEDLFSDKFVSKPTRNAKGPTKAVAKRGNLFDDSDDDIFNSSTTYSLPSKGGAKPPALRDGDVGKSSNLFGDPLSNL